MSAPACDLCGDVGMVGDVDETADPPDVVEVFCDCPAGERRKDGGQ